MSDDLFPGFESHWIDTEVGRVFARSKGNRHAAGAAARLSADPCHVAPPRADARRDPSRRLHGSARLWLVVRAEGRSEARDLFQARHGPRRGRTSWRRSAMCISPSSGTIAARGSATGSRSTIRAASSGSRSSTSCRPIHVWAQMRAGTIPEAHWGYLSQPYPKPEEEIGRDPIPYFEGLDAAMVRRRRSQRLRSPGARMPIGRAATSPPASTPSARITGPARPGTSRPTRPISPPARRSSARPT